MDMHSLPMIGVTLVKDFVKNPPPYFQVQHCVRNPVIRPVQGQVNLCAHDKSHEAWFPDSMGKVLKVETVEQYDQLAHRLLSRPLVFDVKLERRHKSGRIRYILKCDVMVTINTSHPVIMNQMQKLLVEGREDIVAGRNFAIDFSFDSALKAWFSSVHRGQDGIFDTSYDCTYARVVVTNSSEFDDMYSCSPEGVCMFVMCLPCCIFMCPAYRISRCLTTVDRGCDVHGEVSYLTFKTGGPSQEELMLLFLQFLRDQALRESSRATDQPYAGMPDMGAQPNDGQELPARMFQSPHTEYRGMNAGHVEHPASPYPGPPVHGAPSYMASPPPHMPPPHMPPQMASPPGTHISPHDAPVAPSPPYVAQQPLSSASQPPLPSYDFAMRQTAAHDQPMT